MSPHPAQEGHPRISFRWELLDLHRRRIDDLAEAREGRLAESIYTERRQVGSVVVTSYVDWTQMLIRPWVNANGVEYPLVTGLPSIPYPSHSSAVTTTEVEFRDLTQRLASHRRRDYYTAPAGAGVIATVTALIQQADPFSPAIALTPSTEVLRSPMVWAPGTSTLRIVNDLLGTINYGSVWCDEMGVYTATPYVPPAARPVVWEFLPGAGSRHLPDIEEEHNLNGVHNVVIVVCRPTADGELGFVGVASNDDPADPLSTVSVGERARVEEGAEATSQAVADSIAARLLAEERQVIRSVMLQHAWLPLQLTDRVRVRTGRGLDFTGTQVSRDWTLAAGELVNSRIRQG